MKKKLALVTGGLSGEAQISYKSAITVGNNLDSDLFDVYKIDINPEGWWYENGKGEKSKVNRDDFSITHFLIQKIFSSKLFSAFTTTITPQKIITAD